MASAGESSNLASVAAADGSDVTGIVIIERDLQGDSCVAWSFPNPGEAVEATLLSLARFTGEDTVVHDIAHMDGQWAYRCVELAKCTDHAANDILAQKLHTHMYDQLAELMLTTYIACGEPTKLLELFLSATSRGVVKTSILPEANWPAGLAAKADWRASTFDDKAFLHNTGVVECTKPLGSGIVALWSAAVAGQCLLISGKHASHLAMLVPLLGGFPARNTHGYDSIFPCISPASASAVASGATPSSLAEAASADGGALADLLSAATYGSGRVLASADSHTASSLLSRRSWWDIAVNSDTGAVTSSQGGAAWGAGGAASDFPSPLHKAVWDFVQADLAALADLPPQDALWKFAAAWQAASDKFVLGPLRKLTEAHGGQLTRAAINQPSLTPAAQAFLWQAAHVLQGEGVEGVHLATEGVQGGEAEAAT